MRKIYAFFTIAFILILMTACASNDHQKDYNDIELYMTYGEVVDLLGEADKGYYEWHFSDGTKLHINFDYPGVFSGNKSRDEFIVVGYRIYNESLLPTTQPVADPTE